MKPIIISAALTFVILAAACSKNSTNSPTSSYPGHFIGKYQLYDSNVETYYSNTGSSFDTDHRINTLITISVDSNSNSLNYEGIIYKRDSTSYIYKYYGNDYHEIRLTEDSILVTHITNSRIRVFDNALVSGYRIH